MNKGLVLATHEAEQELEHVDKVQIQAERAHNDHFANHVRASHIRIHILNTLRIIGCQACEDQNTNRADDKVHHCGLQEDVDHHRYQQADNTHDQETAPTGQVFLRRVAKKAKTQESRRCRKESLGDRCAGIDEEDRRHGKTH